MDKEIAILLHRLDGEIGYLTHEKPVDIKNPPFEPVSFVQLPVERANAIVDTLQKTHDFLSELQDAAD